MRKISSLLIIIILILAWLNIKDRAQIIESGTLSSPKNKPLVLNPFEEKIILEKPQSKLLNTSFQSSLSDLSQSQNSFQLPSPSTTSIKSLPINALNLNIATNSNESDKIAMEKYLRDSSDLNFPDNMEVSLALFEARDGNPSKMYAVIKSFNEKIPKLEALVPPEQLKQFHEKSLSSIKIYVSLLEQIASNAGNKQKILEILNSSQMNQARNQAREILNNLRDIVKKYNLSLPPEVLPKDKIPSITP